MPEPAGTGHQRGRVFGAAAAEYERARPAYPAAAVDWLLADAGPRVLDLGAGTGKITRLLRERRDDVVAVEPSSRMRAALVQAVPGVAALPGTAEQIPLPDRSLDVVVVAQAWHWVDVDRAVAEVARVLVGGGRLGLVWNVRDERRDWVARLGSLLAVHTHEGVHDYSPRVGAPFGALARREVEWEHVQDPQGLLDLVASRSYVISLPPADRAALLDDVAALLRTHPETRGRDEITVPYVTRCFRATMAGRGLIGGA